MPLFLDFLLLPLFSRFLSDETIDFFPLWPLPSVCTIQWWTPGCDRGNGSGPPSPGGAQQRQGRRQVLVDGLRRLWWGQQHRGVVVLSLCLIPSKIIKNKDLGGTKNYIKYSRSSKKELFDEKRSKSDERVTLEPTLFLSIIHYSYLLFMVSRSAWLSPVQSCTLEIKNL